MTDPDNSILQNTKKAVGVEPTDTNFDVDITMHINSVFSTLNQLGIGPVNGFEIVDGAETWTDFIPSDIRLNNVRSYVFLRVKLLFDPPPTSFAIAAIKEQIIELEWRINTYREDTAWTAPA